MPMHPTHSCEMRARCLWEGKVLERSDPLDKQDVLTLWEKVPTKLIHTGGPRDRHVVFGINPRLRNTLSVAAQQLPWTTRVLTEFVKGISPPGFLFDTILVREGGNLKPHRDNNGIHPTLLVSLTVNQGGGLWIQDPEGHELLGSERGVIRPIDSPLVFDATNLLHAGTPWTEDTRRVVLVARSSPTLDTWEPSSRWNLLELGFVLPPLKPKPGRSQTQRPGPYTPTVLDMLRAPGNSSPRDKSGIPTHAPIIDLTGPSDEE